MYHIALSCPGSISLIEFPITSVAMYLDEVQCTGNETSLVMCESNIEDTSCTTREGAGVRCECM